MPSKPHPSKRRLSVGRKIGFAAGNLASNAMLSSLTLIYATFFFVEIAGLRPALAGLVPLIGRAVDAFTDPMMGRLSDATTIRGERRRPYILLGLVPMVITFALLWRTPAEASQTAMFVYYTAVYCAFSVAMTVALIPYLALVPEMALGYDERTSLTTYTNFASLLGIGVAIGMRPVADSFGGGADGYAAAGWAMALFGGVLWIAAWASAFERPEFTARPSDMRFVEQLLTAMRQRTFLQLTKMYLAGRIAMDLVGGLLVLYFIHWLHRGDAFEGTMVVFLGTSALSMPLWLKFARGRDKRHVFVVGSVLWLSAQLLLYPAQPDWPEYFMYAFAPLLAIGYAVVDFMPWAMVGDVIDEDELETGERREGLFNGVFLFIRKLAGAAAVAGAMGLLDVAGLGQGEESTEGARQAVRMMTVFAPVACLAVGIWFARGYPLTRERHAEIIEALEAKRRA